MSYSEYVWNRILVSIYVGFIGLPLHGKGKYRDSHSRWVHLLTHEQRYDFLAHYHLYKLIIYYFYAERPLEGKWDYPFPEFGFNELSLVFLECAGSCQL